MVKTSHHNVYFTEVFGVDPAVLDSHGAFNIALVNDLPLFVDPFLLFDSKDPNFLGLHDELIKYLCFLRDRAIEGPLTSGQISHWFLFKEVRQNWLGFSEQGNRGTGLGRSFASSLVENLCHIFKDFGSSRITKGSHIEKLGLLSGGVGRDHISDFTTNLIKGYLAEYTQTFALTHLRPNQRAHFAVDKVTFNYVTQRWSGGTFELPNLSGDYVLLTPKAILTRDEAWINQQDMLGMFTQIQNALPDRQLRDQVADHFRAQISARSKASERNAAALRTISKFTELLDRYIQIKEATAAQAHTRSKAKVKDTEQQFVLNVQRLVADHLAGTEFYEHGTSYDESRNRVMYLKHVIEDQGGHRLFYLDGKPIQRETDLHIMYRLTFFSAEVDLNAEVNNGRGPVDFKVSRGKADAALIEFKLAKNTGLQRNLQHQTNIYEKASDVRRSIKVIVHFSRAERVRVEGVLKRLGLAGRDDIILIDAARENKVSASKATQS